MESKNVNNNQGGIGGLHIIVPLILNKDKNGLKRVLNDTFGYKGDANEKTSK